MHEMVIKQVLNKRFGECYYCNISDHTSERKKMFYLKTHSTHSGVVLWSCICGT